MSEPRVVVDASSLVRAVLDPASAAAQLLVSLRGRAWLVASFEMLEKITEVLARPKFARRISAERRRAFLQSLAAAVELVDPQLRAADCRDPNDDRVLETALAGGTTIIAPDDRDMLALDPWRGVRGCKP